MKDDRDTDPLTVQSNVDDITCMSWNNDGTILAVGGLTNSLNGNPSEEKSPILQFFNSHGKPLHYLIVPGTSLASLSWEGFFLETSNMLKSNHLFLF